MAFVNTDNTPDQGKGFSSIGDIVRSLRGAYADELSATNLYTKIIDTLKYMNGHDDAISKLEEIAKDEQNHQGILLQLISSFSADELKNIINGFNGEEGEQEVEPKVSKELSDFFEHHKHHHGHHGEEPVIAEKEVTEVAPIVKDVTKESNVLADIPMDLFDAHK